MSCIDYRSLTFVSAAEARQPDSVSLRASGHAAEVASAGRPRRGRVPDRSGRQRAPGGTDGGRHEGVAQDPEEDGREVGSSSFDRTSIFTHFFLLHLAQTPKDGVTVYP